MFEYCGRSVYGYDSASWAKFDDCSFCQAWVYQSRAIDFVADISATGCYSNGYDEPVYCGPKSAIVGWQMANVAGQLTTINGSRINRYVTCAAGATVLVAQIDIPNSTALRSSIEVRSEEHTSELQSLMRNTYA